MLPLLCMDVFNFRVCMCAPIQPSITTAVLHISHERTPPSLLQVEKLMLCVQSCAYGSEDGVLTADILKRVVTQKAKEHGAKVKMTAPTHA